MAGIIKVDRVQSDSNLAFNIAGANVAFMNATSLQMVGSNVSLAGTNVITSGKVLATAMYPGAVLQVVQTVKTSYFTSASASFVDVTGLSVSITPSSTSSKILVMFSGYAAQSGTAGTYGIHLKLVRNSTDIFLGDAAGSAQQSAAQIGSNNGHYAQNLSGQYLDSPSTTSSITYKIQMYVENGGTGGLGGGYLTTAAYDGRTPSTITAMEIAG